MAKKYRVTPYLVNKLIKEAKQQPQKLRELKKKEKDAQSTWATVMATASDLLEKSIPIIKAA